MSITMLHADCMAEKKPHWITLRMKGVKRNPESVAKGAAKLRKGSFFSCQLCGNQFWRAPNEIAKGQNKFCSRKCYLENQVGKPKSEPFIAFCRTRKGEKSPSWQGGKTPEQKKIRASEDYKLWRFSVFNRDGGKCRHCGKGRP